LQFFVVVDYKVIVELLLRHDGRNELRRLSLEETKVVGRMTAHFVSVLWRLVNFKIQAVEMPGQGFAEQHFDIHDFYNDSLKST
jgi:hypothetical protein